MTLRLRLGLIVSATLLVGFAVFGSVSYLRFVQAQDRQLQELVDRDLERIRALIRDPVVGAPLLRADGGAYEEQLVSRAGVVVLPTDAGPPLPLYRSPTLDTSSGTPKVVGSVAWTSASGAELGTIRLGLDVSDAMVERRTLASVLIGSGAAIALFFAGLAFASVGRALRPLTDLAAQARSVDPVHPTTTRYAGPQDEVGDVAAALNGALRGIQERRDAERASLAEVAHELAAPLSVVTGQLQVLARTHPEDARVVAAHVAARELLHTSQDLLALARGELEHPLRLEVVDVAEVARQVADEFPGVEGRSRGRAHVIGDPDRLRQLARNLVRNAVQASDGTMGVRWSVEVMQNAVVLSVLDRGPGIAHADIDRVFDRFHSSRGGAGIGLAVAKRIAEQHRATIDVASVPGTQTRFSVRFPDAESQMDSNEA